MFHFDRVVGFALAGHEATEREEHKVELIWSVKSGKTRLVWNGADVTNLFTPRVSPEMVEISWMTQMGISLRVVAHAEEIDGVNQYDLFVDTDSFFGFPALDELLPHESAPERDEKLASSFSDFEARYESQQEALSDAGSGANFCPIPTADVGFRLSMVGLNAVADISHNEIKDELHSELYSPMLESLRSQISEYLPQLEDEVSRAIINAFYVDPDATQDSISATSSSSSLESALTTSNADPYQVEADALRETYEFVAANRKKLSSSDDCCDLYHTYMQKRIDSVFVKVRNDELKPEQATRILLSIASVLRLKFAKPMPRDTVVFTGLSTSVTAEDLYKAIIPYGCVSATAVASGAHGFGYCRFEDTVSAAMLDQANRRRQFQVLEHPPACAIVLSERLQEDMEDNESRELEDQRTEDESQGQVRCYTSTPPSHSIPHLMAPLGSCDYEAEFTLEPNVSSPISAGDPIDANTPTSAKSSPSSDRTCSTSSVSDSDLENSNHFKQGFSSPHSVASILRVDQRHIPGTTRFPHIS